MQYMPATNSISTHLPSQDSSMHHPAFGTNLASNCIKRTEPCKLFGSFRSSKMAVPSWKRRKKVLNSENRDPKKPQSCQLKTTHTPSHPKTISQWSTGFSPKPHTFFPSRLTKTPLVPLVPQSLIYKGGCVGDHQHSTSKNLAARGHKRQLFRTTMELAAHGCFICLQTKQAEQNHYGKILMEICRDTQRMLSLWLLFCWVSLKMLNLDL